MTREKKVGRYNKQTRLERREEIRKRLLSGETVADIEEAMGAASATIYAVKKTLAQQVIPANPGAVDLNTFWVETVIRDGRGKPVTNVACPLPSYKLGLELALRSLGLKP